MDTRLFERSDQLNVILQAAAGGGYVVLVTGEAGVGKTALIDAFVARTEAHVHRGACDDLLMQPALGGLREALGADLQGDSDMDGLLAAVNNLLAHARPTALVIEDVHWADDATLDVLRYLTRRIASTNLVVLLTYRDDSLDVRHPLRQLLSAIATVPQVRVELRPLSLAAVSDMAAGSRWQPSELHALTGGNPFFVTEILAGDEALSGPVVDVVLARVQQLGDEGIDLLEQLAVMPAGATHAFVNDSFDSAHDLLVHAERRGLLVDRREGVAFRHEIARRAVEQSIVPSRRRLLNQNVLQWLLKQPEVRPTSVLQYAVEAGDVDELLRYAPLAAVEATNAGAHRQALIAFEALMPHVERLAQEERAYCFDNYAWELHLAGRFLDAIGITERAIALWETLGHETAHARSLIMLARHLYVAGDLRKTVQVVEHAVAVARSADSLTDAAAAETLLAIVSVTGHQSDSATLLDRASETSARTGLVAMEAVCASFRGVHRSMQGDVGGLAEMRAAVDLAVAHGDSETASRVRVNLLETAYLLHDWRDLAEEFEKAAEFGSRYGYWHNVFVAEAHRAMLEIRQGHWAVAERRLQRLVDSSDGSAQPTLYTVPTMGRLLARRGDPRAEQLLSDIWERALVLHAMPGSVHAATAYLEWAWLNDRQDVAGRIRDALLSELPAATAPIFTELRRYLARARVPLEPVVDAAAPEDGFTLALRGQPAVAAAYWARLGDQYEQALELAELDDDSARRALGMFEGLGAVKPAARLRAALKSRGVEGLPPGFRPRNRENPANLTERQLDILRHLVKGITNAEIAEELVLSVRTVEHHVAAILQKLDAPNRRAAVDIAKRLRITGQ